MGSAPLLVLGSWPIAMLVMSKYPIFFFFKFLIAVPLSSFCVFVSLCVACVVLALVFLPGLHFAAYRAAFLA